MIVRDSGRGNTPLVWAIEGDREFVVMSPTDGGQGRETTSDAADHRTDVTAPPLPRWLGPDIAG
jgi:hypothetical protein